MYLTSEFSSKVFINFIQRFSNFLKISQHFVFRPNAQKSNAWFAKSLEKYAKELYFQKFSLDIFSNCSKFLLRPGAERPRTRHDASRKVFPQMKKPGSATGSNEDSKNALRLPY